MKKSFIGAAVVLSFLIPAAAQAQSPAQAQDQASISVTAPRQSYTLGANEFTEFANMYALSNGQVAQFVQRGNHYYVQLKDTVRSMQRAENSTKKMVATRLRPVGPGAFVTDSGAELSFRDNGEEVRISGFERLPDARVAAAQTNVLMVARR
ncbi:hypothetical protein GJV26_17035 [Massilia dura]|uniref:Gel scht n=1 Tax=Pseudoduganella dura TaxID=321982 RepID=A0A6I3XNF3_9BURK|nr:hypothetical protein [Pseudoduganella dura]MUI14148.1 hypothetical protein [Pseudoduganella dura]GGX76789.1 hypothetical protein GCM10007386_04950 [Pseudoduganella dura]